MDGLIKTMFDCLDRDLRSQLGLFPTPNDLRDALQIQQLRDITTLTEEVRVLQETIRNN